jgi:hypothetical protein
MMYFLGIFFGSSIMLGAAQADEWQWIRVSPDTTQNKIGWQVLQGKADVKILNGNISTELKYDDDRYYYHFSIGGTVKNGAIRATEIQENTDASPRVLTGTAEIVDNPKADWGFDRVILKDGATFVTLFRIVKK